MPRRNSLVSSTKANGVEPFAWLKDVFGRLLYHRDGEPVASDELDYLLPGVWLEANSDHTWDIDKIRRAEREAKEV